MYYDVFDVKAEICCTNGFILSCTKIDRYESHATSIFLHMCTQILKTAQQASLNLSSLPPHKAETTVEVSGPQNVHSQDCNLVTDVTQYAIVAVFHVPRDWAEFLSPFFFFLNKLWSEPVSLYFLYYITGRFRQVVVGGTYSCSRDKTWMCVFRKVTECGLWFLSTPISSLINFVCLRRTCSTHTMHHILHNSHCRRWCFCFFLFFFRPEWEKWYQTGSVRPLPRNWETSCRDQRPSKMPRRSSFRHTDMLISSSISDSSRFPRSRRSLSRCLFTHIGKTLSERHICIDMQIICVHSLLRKWHRITLFTGWGTPA